MGDSARPETAEPSPRPGRRYQPELVVRRLGLLVALVATVTLPCLLLVPRSDRVRYAEVAAFFAVGSHILTQNVMRWSCERVLKLVDSAELPEWVGALAERNLAKAHLLSYAAAFSIMMLMIGRYRGWVDGPALGAFAALCLAFHLVAFAGEYAMMAAQARLLEAVEGMARASRGDVPGDED